MLSIINALTRLLHLCKDYDAAGQITKWSQKQGTQPQTEYALHNDAAGQLDGATLKDSTTSTVLKQFAWGFDAAGNRVSQTVDAVTTTYTANTLNQMTQVQDGNPVLFKGKVNKPSVVQVQGVSVTADSHNLFAVPLALSYGAHTITITAQSGAESLTQTYGVFSGQALTYDLNGNMTSDGKLAYTYDAANRLVNISTLNPGPANPAKSSTFVYDGLWRRVEILEKQGVQTIADRHFIWDGGNIVEERDSSNLVQKRFYTNGVQLLSGSGAGTYYYQRDHLGSIRSVLNGQGLSVASYDYDLWGVRTRTAGTFDADFGYAGYFEHQPSGLGLTLFRGYQSLIGRWINRDPIGENGGINLYEYVQNQPSNWSDESGLVGASCTYGGGAYAGSVGGSVSGGVWAGTGGVGTVVTTGTGKGGYMGGGATFTVFSGDTPYGRGTSKSVGLGALSVSVGYDNANRPNSISVGVGPSLPKLNGTSGTTNSVGNNFLELAYQQVTRWISGCH